jgi:hypothetical protein
VGALALVKQASEEKVLRDAVEENRTRGITASRRNSKVRTYNYKKPVKKKTLKRKLALDKRSAGLNDRNVREWQPWEEAILFVDGSVVLDELTKKQVSCEHKALKNEPNTAVAGSWEVREYRICPSCQSFLRWYGSYTNTLRAEWMSLRVEGYEMDEWGSIFTKDKTMWLFLLEEAQANKEDDNVRTD